MKGAQTRTNRLSPGVFAHQHISLLRLCSQIADLDIPALIEVLSGIRSALGDGPLDAGEEDTRSMAEDNLALARLALQIRTEVDRQMRSRCGIAVLSRLPS